MSRAIRSCALWRHMPGDIFTRIEAQVDRGPKAAVFFRADDVAIPSAGQDRLLDLFARHGVPLCAAIVPAWLNQSRWQAICRVARDKHHLFAWHQHGWRHRNHETSGKKQEFGPGAGLAEKRAGILRGRDKLTTLLGNRFCPVFTPPWNRLDEETMHILRAEGFRAISRFRGDRLAALPGLPDLPVNVDLHTRKEGSAEAGWSAVLAELDQALAAGSVGFMLHHQRMDQAAFAFLDALLPLLRGCASLRLCHFGDLLDSFAGAPHNFVALPPD